MKWSIGTKISGLVAFSIISSIILGIVSFQTITKLMSSVGLNTHSYNVIEQQKQLMSTLQDAERGQRGFIITGAERYLEPYNLAVKSVSPLIANVITLTADNPNQQKRLVNLKSLIEAKFEELNQTIELRKKNQYQAALQIILSDTGRDIMDDIRNLHDEIVNEELALLKTRRAMMKNDALSTVDTISYGTSLSIILLLIVGFFIIRNISIPLKAITRTASLIAEGNLNVKLEVISRKDEIGLLNLAFSKMLEKLRGSITDINEGINLLSSSTSEILAATTQVASGAAETATAISETTTTVEEVRHAAQLSNQKASRVSENAQQVVQIAQAGQTAVNETVSSMNDIKKQMESVANTIMRLSEQSLQIGGIVASVTDVADQSNLLAVNAAIEAAKAGEQGKGFVVVSDEIRRLALQSKQATIQVRNILTDIQKATSAAVMATEQTSKAVENGVLKSNEAGESIRKLAESSSKAVEAATLIVSSSQQQVIGMDQIGLAMTNINQAGRENAVSMAQSEKAAKDLNELGQKLKHLVAQYII